MDDEITLIGTVNIARNPCTNSLAFVDEDGDVVLFNGDEVKELKELLNGLSDL